MARRSCLSSSPVPAAHRSAALGLDCRPASKPKGCHVGMRHYASPLEGQQPTLSDRSYPDFHKSGPRRMGDDLHRPQPPEAGAGWAPSPLRTFHPLRPQPRSCRPNPLLGRAPSQGTPPARAHGSSDQPHLSRRLAGRQPARTRQSAFGSGRSQPERNEFAISIHSGAVPARPDRAVTQKPLSSTIYSRGGQFRSLLGRAITTMGW